MGQADARSDATNVEDRFEERYRYANNPTLARDANDESTKTSLPTHVPYKNGLEFDPNKKRQAYTLLANDAAEKSIKKACLFLSRLRPRCLITLRSSVLPALACPRQK